MGWTLKKNIKKQTHRKSQPVQSSQSNNPFSLPWGNRKTGRVIQSSTLSLIRQSSPVSPPTQSTFVQYMYILPHISLPPPQWAGAPACGGSGCQSVRVRRHGPRWGGSGPLKTPRHPHSKKQINSNGSKLIRSTRRKSTI